MKETVLVTARELAGWLQCSDRMVREWTERGIIERAAPGQYDLKESIGRHALYFRELSAGRLSDDETLDLAAERARLAKAQADAQEMKNGLSAGRLLPAEEVAAGVEGMIGRCRAKLLGMPARLAPEVIGLDSLSQIVGVIEDGVHEALTELSQTRIQPTDDDDQSAHGGPADVGDEPVEAAPATDRKRVGRQRAKAKPGSKRGARKVANRKG